MIKYYENKNNHPMFGKTHTKEALALISKPGEWNPRSRKRPCEFTKAIISEKMSKRPLGTGI